MSRQIAAVHAGNIERAKRLERAGFIPIVEVPAIPLESLHRGEGVLRASNQAARRKIAQIPAARLASSARPIFVGEVREAIVGTGTS
jgi:hypothetical protein